MIDTVSVATPLQIQRLLRIDSMRDLYPKAGQGVDAVIRLTPSGLIIKRFEFHRLAWPKHADESRDVDDAGRVVHDLVDAFDA